MQERRRLWNVILEAHGIDKGSEEEDLLIRKYFKAHKPQSFRTDLTRGFASIHQDALQAICRDHGTAFISKIWLRIGQSRRNTLPPIEFVGEPLRAPEDFYRRLSALYASAGTYDCVRVGGIYSRNRTLFEYDRQGLALRPLGDSVRMAYLRIFWDRLRNKSLRGTSVHVVKTIDRLVELWASLELLRKKKLLSENSVWLAPVVRADPAKDLPAIGVRIVDNDKTLLSLPARPEDHSRYSSWISTEVLADFARDYTARAKEVSRPLSNETPPSLRRVIEAAHAQLLPANVAEDPPSGNYGVLDTFRRVENVKDRMIDWAQNDLWLPVIA